MLGIPQNMEQEAGKMATKACDCCQEGECGRWRSVTNKRKGKSLCMGTLNICTGELNFPYECKDRHH